MHLQNLIVLAIVAFAVYYLVRRMTRSAQGHDGAGCSKCACGEGEKKAV
jgi:FeoB-associated Cys-rich membrane protein